MRYDTWSKHFAAKHKKIVQKLTARGFNKEEIIDYFDFDNMVEKENNFCELYKKPVKCHDMQKLNCYLCGCPHFRFNDEGIGEYNGIKIVSGCDINNGSTIAKEGVIHQDCSQCTVPHHKAFIKKRFDLDWKKIMHACKADV